MTKSTGLWILVTVVAVGLVGALTGQLRGGGAGCPFGACGPDVSSTAAPTETKACPAGCTKPCCADKADGAKACCDGPCAKCKATAAASLEKSVAAIDAATKAVESGDKTAALAKLSEVRGTLTAMHAKMTAPASTTAAKPAADATPTFANAKCPIMGSPIKAAKVTPALTREFNGRHVAFCCGGCPAKWDKLSDEQKTAALEKAK